MSSEKIKFQRLSPDVVIPEYKTVDSAGFDFTYVGENYSLKPGERKAFETGLAMQIPKGHELQIRPRSGLALNHGITVLNSPGTIDADYRGEVQVILINHGSAVYEIKKGERIAQGVLAPVTRATFEVVSELEKTVRGSGGFGHTGK